MVSEKDQRLREKDQLLREMASEKERHIRNLEHQLLQTEKDNLLLKARGKAVLGSRIVLEIGLASCYPALGSATNRYEKLWDDHLLDSGRLKSKCTIATKGGTSPADVFKTLTKKHGFRDDVKGAAREAKDLYHELSKEMHNLAQFLPDQEGIYVGGREPMATMLAIAINQLQQAGHIQFDVFPLSGMDSTQACKLQRNGTVV
mmetsp:Transcript_43615/g.102531  ORF Transcript_43615/g.102531 Transcript_43615/m.102531 type:complete len:203 (-) Transcript_43615:54-662(-)